jgi:prephenate dehydratase
MKAAFQGVHGAYSELASKQLLGKRCVTLPCESFEDVFTAVEKGKADLGVIPIENSLAGSIHQNYDLLLARKLHIVGEAHLRVEHVLMCHPSASFGDLKRVRSHPQALAQCSGFFAKARGIKPEVFFDTAGAAESLAKEAPSDTGAIASEYAARLYGLKVLRRNLQNHADNFTRFLAISKRPRAPGAANAKTSIAFMPKGNQVGILFRILGVFALREIDLLKIESRPNPLSPFEYWFYLDFAGGAGETKVDKALDHLREMAAEMKILGSYPGAAKAARSGRRSGGRRNAGRGKR